MGVTTVIKDYGTDILNAIRENDLQTLKNILEKQLKSASKIAKLCVSDIKHRPTKKFACPLILAARQEDCQIIHYMMEKGVDPNFVHHTVFSSKRKEIVTALHIAVDLGYYDTVEILMAANADANIGDHNQETPLHIAVKKADRVMVRMLLSKGADPAIPDRRGNASLHIATLYGHLQLVKIMLKYDADVYQQGQFGAIPPHIAAKEGHIHLIQLFCSRDMGNINIKIPCYGDQREKALIHLAAENAHIETVRSLLAQFDADVNLKDSDGNTALHCLVLYPFDPHRMRDRDDFNETARILIKNRVSINEKNVFGDTALHLAAMNHFQRIVELLLEVGANPLVENEEGLKPIDVVPDSDPVTRNILKSAMLNPRPPKSINSSMDTLERGNESLRQTNLRHALMADGVVLSSSQGTPENPLDRSLSINSGSFPSVFEGSQTGSQKNKELPQKPPEDPQGLGRVPVQPQVKKAIVPGQGQRHPLPLQAQSATPGQPHHNKYRKNNQSLDLDDYEDENKKDSLYGNLSENEIPTYSRVEKNKKKKDRHRKSQDDDTISYTTQSSVNDDASSIFSMGPTNANAVVQREIQKLFSKNQQNQKKKKKKTESVTSDNTSVTGTTVTETSVTDVTGSTVTDRLNNSIEMSIDSQHYVPMGSVEKKKKKQHRDEERKYHDDENIYANKENVNDFDPYKDDRDVYKNLGAASLANSDISDMSDVKKKKKHGSKSKLNQILAGARAEKEVAPYDTKQVKTQSAARSHGLQPGSVKVNTVPGKPGTIEVQYSGGPIMISVDTSCVDQLADGQYYFTDEHGNQFPIDIENPQDIAALKSFTQPQKKDKPLPAPPLPPKNEPIYANQQELNQAGTRVFRSLPDVPKETPMRHKNDSTYKSPKITELDSDEEDELDDEDDLSQSGSDDIISNLIRGKVKETMKTSKDRNQNLEKRGTLSKSEKPAVQPRTEHHRGTPTKDKKGKSNSKLDQILAGAKKAPRDKKKPIKLVDEQLDAEEHEEEAARSLLVTQTVSNQEKAEEDRDVTQDESPNISPQHKSFADKLKWAKGTAGEVKPKPRKRQDHPLLAKEKNKELKGTRKENKLTHEKAQDMDESVSDNEHQQDQDDDSSSSESEGGSVLVSPTKHRDHQKRKDHQKMYSLSGQINIEKSDDESGSSSDGQSSVVHKPKPKPEPRKLQLRETRSNVVIAMETKNEEMTHLQTMPYEKIDVQRGDWKPKVKPRKSLEVVEDSLPPHPSPHDGLLAEEEPLPAPPAEEELEIQHTEVSRQAQKDNGSANILNQSTEELEMYLSEPGTRRLGRAMERRGLSYEEVSTLSEDNRSQSVDSFLSEYSEGGTRRLKIRVTGEVPKAYDRQHMGLARTAFILRKKAEDLESAGEASDVETGSRGSLDRIASPASTDRAKRWSEEARPISAKSPEGLLPRNSSPCRSNKLSPLPPVGKSKLIGSYAKPYKSFGKIEVKTDALESDDAWMYSPMPSPLSIHSPTQLSPYDERQKVDIDTSPPNQGKPVTFPSAQIKINKSSPVLERVDVVRPQAIPAQPVDNVIRSDLPQAVFSPETQSRDVGANNSAFINIASQSKVTEKYIQQVDETKSTDVPQVNTAVNPHESTLPTTANDLSPMIEDQITIAKIPAEQHQEVQPTKSVGNKQYHINENIAPKAEDLKQYEVKKSSVSEATNPEMKKKKTVSVREMKFSQSGDPVETVTTTVKASTFERYQPTKIDIFEGESSSETETSESEDESSEDSSSDEGMMEYSAEKGVQIIHPKKDIMKNEAKIVPIRHNEKTDDTELSQSFKTMKMNEEETKQKPSIVGYMNEAKAASQYPTENEEKVKKPAVYDDVFEPLESHKRKSKGERPPLKPFIPEETSSKDNCIGGHAKVETNMEGVPFPSNEHAKEIKETNLDNLMSKTKQTYDQFEGEPGQRRPKLWPSEPPPQPPAQPPVMEHDKAQVPIQIASCKIPITGEITAHQESSSNQYEKEPGTRRPKSKSNLQLSKILAAASSQPQTRDALVTNNAQNPSVTTNDQSHCLSQNTEPPSQSLSASQNEPKKERIKGRRQIGGPKKGERITATSPEVIRSHPTPVTKPMNTSFGAEDEEVALINTQMKDRKEAVKSKKLKEHEWALKQKALLEEQAATEWEQALMAAQAQHSNVTKQLNKKDLAQSTPHTHSGEIVEEYYNKTSDPLKSSLPDKVDIDKSNKLAFLKFPSKKEKKEKDKSKLSKEDLTHDSEEKRKGLFGKTKKSKKQHIENQSGTPQTNVGREPIKYVDNKDHPKTPEKTTSALLDTGSPVSPEGYGIEQTVMGATVERDDTIKQRPEGIHLESFFKLPSKRQKEDDSKEDIYEDAPEVEPMQSGLSQNEILAGLLKQQAKTSGKQNNIGSQNQAPPLPPLDLHRPPIPGAPPPLLPRQHPPQTSQFKRPVGAPPPPPTAKVPTKETCIDDDLYLEPQALNSEKKFEPIETNIDDDLPSYPADAPLEEAPKPPSFIKSPLVSQSSLDMEVPIDLDVVMRNRKNLLDHGPFPPPPRDSQLDMEVLMDEDFDDPPEPPPPEPSVQPFNRNHSSRVSKGKKKSKRPKSQLQNDGTLGEHEVAQNSILPLSHSQDHHYVLEGNQRPVQQQRDIVSDLYVGLQDKEEHHVPVNEQPGQDTKYHDQLNTYSTIDPHPQNPHGTSVHQNTHQPKQATEYFGLEDDPAALSQMWRSRKDQEADMLRVLTSTQNGSSTDKRAKHEDAQEDDDDDDDDEANYLYEQPVCHGQLTAAPILSLAPQQQHQPGSAQSAPATSKPPLALRTFREDHLSQGVISRQRGQPNNNADPAAQMWAQQQGKVEVVEIPPGGFSRHQSAPPIGPGGLPVRDDPSRRPLRGTRTGPPSTSSLPAAALSDSETHNKSAPIISSSASTRSARRQKRSRAKEARRNMSLDRYHSETEMNRFDAPLPPGSGKSLQEAAFETITSGLKNQPKTTAYHPLVSPAERHVNYTRGVYRPPPMNWRGSGQGSGGGSRYDDSSLVSALWSSQPSLGVSGRESEGEAADTEYDPSAGVYEEPVQHQGWHGQPAGAPMHPAHMGHQPPPSPKRPPTAPNQPPVKLRPKRKKKQWITEPGPVDFSQYGPTAKIWMEQVDEKTVQKSSTMMLSVMPRDHKLHPDIEQSMPPDTRTLHASMGEDQVFLPPQWVIARGRSVRKQKRALDAQRNASGGSENEYEAPISPGGLQKLLFFRVGSNWMDLAWLLFDEVQNDPETIRMIKDIQLKSPKDLTAQVNDLMQRWWKKRGTDATIEELTRALDMVHIPYINEECTDHKPSIAHSGSEDNLDVSAISEQDPEVSRLRNEYRVRSLNNSFEGGALSDSGMDGKRSYTSTDSLVRRLNDKGVSINRSNLGSLGSRFTSSTFSHNSSRGSADEFSYYSDGESRRSFVIVQPQLKGGEYRHETNI